MDLSGWLTKNQVAAELGCSTKTVERHSKSGGLSKRVRPRPGLQSEVVYDPGDVAKLKHSLAMAREAELSKVSPAVQTPDEEAASLGQMLATRRTKAESPSRAELFMAMLQESSAAFVPIHQRLYLNYSDAMKLTGLSEATLRQAVRDGTVKTMPYGSGVRLRRMDLEKL